MGCGRDKTARGTPHGDSNPMPGQRIGRRAPFALNSLLQGAPHANALRAPARHHAHRTGVVGGDWMQSRARRHRFQTDPDRQGTEPLPGLWCHPHLKAARQRKSGHTALTRQPRRLEKRGEGFP